MKISRYFKNRCFLFLSVIFLSMTIIGPKTAIAEPYKVAIIPFKINAEKDFTFLKDGIFDMLASRLSWGKKVIVISREEAERALDGRESPIDEGAVRDIGARLGVDFVLYGSLTIIGNSVSLDVKMGDVSGKQPVHAFFSQSQGMDEIIPKINLFATEINEKVLGRRVALKPEPKQPQPEQPDLYAHPEKLVEGGFVGNGAQDQRTGSELLFAAGDGARLLSMKFRKTRNFKHYITGMALGDVDGDGNQETVIATHRAVFVYRSKNNRFLKIAETADERYRNNIGVDVADINGNGYAEIFVSRLNSHRKGVSSMVLEWNGDRLKKIVDNSPWYYRVAEPSGRDIVLLGQRQKQRDPFRGELCEMVWAKGTYVPEKKILYLKQNNLMGLTVGDVMNDDRHMVVAYNQGDHLQVIDPPGKVEWKDNEYLGGSMLYFLLPKAGREEMEQRQYLPMRVRIQDIDGDGQKEVIAAKNHEMAGRHLGQFRKFKTGRIMVLSWDGIGLARMWTTRKVSGHISDFSIGDFDNDGIDELVASVVVKEGAMVMTTPKSTIIVYELNTK